MLKITSENFEKEVLQAEKPVLVDLWADWCGPCQMMGPVLEEVAAERTDLIVGKLNVDENMDLAMQLKAVSIPLFLLFKKGQVAAKAIGYMSKEELLKALGL